MKKLLLIATLAILTNNANAQWQTNGPYGGGARNLAVSGSNIFAISGNSYGGVYLSTNNGNYWTKVDSGIPWPLVSTLAIKDSNIYAGTQGRGVCLSTNYGQSWMSIDSGLGNINITSLAVSGSSIFAGADGGIFVFNNTDTTWTHSGLIDSGIVSLAVSGSSIFAVTSNYGAFVSANNGITWSAVNTGIPSSDFAPSLIVSGPNVIAMVGRTNTGTTDLLLSTDNGITWSNSFTNININSVAFSGSSIFAGTESNGLYVSSDQGITWNASDSALPLKNNTWVTSVVASDTNIFLSTQYEGVFLSTDNGISWSMVNNGIKGTLPDLFAVSGSNTYVGTTQGGLFLSSNNGNNWTPLNIASAGQNILDYYISALAASDSNIFAGTLGGLFLSTNSGGNWRLLNSGLPTASVTSLAINGSTIFAGTSDSGVFLSNNNGSNWMAVNNGITNLNINAVAINGSSIFAGTFHKGIFLSNNNGVTWNAINTGLLDTSSSYNVKAFTISGSNIFAVTNGGVYLSTDDGSTWTPTHLGGAATTGISINGPDIFAVATDGTFIVSTNDGVSATGVNEDGMLGNSFFSSAISGDYMFVAAQGATPQLKYNSCVYQRLLADITGVQEINASPASDFKLYPNPSSGVFVIETSETEKQLLLVFDMTGNLMLSQNIQNKQTNIDARNLASGIYIVSIRGTEGATNKKLVITR